MATNKYLSKLQDIQKREGNERCIDCNASNPQWASIPFGILFCLECSGKHRALGVHISFVRSITMDKWSEQQVKKMDLGGNARAVEFFKKSPEFSDDMTIEKKYTSRFAQDYREKLAAECEGKAWAPTASSEASPRIPTANSPSTSRRSTTGTSTGIQRTASADSVSSRSSSRVPMRRNPSANSKSSPGTSRRVENDTGSGTSSPRGGNEKYFAKLGEANESRPADLPPNQGGRYAGFGNTPDTVSPTTPGIPDIGDLLVDPLGTLSKGLSLLSLGATSALGHAVEGARNLNASILQPATERLTETVRDPELPGRVTGYVSSLSRTVHDTSSKGFNYFSEYLQPHSNTQTYSELGADLGENSENFKTYRDACGDDDGDEPETWKSVDHPVSGSTTSTRLGSTSMPSTHNRGSTTMQMRRGKGAPTKRGDAWGDDNDEWSKF